MVARKTTKAAKAAKAVPTAKPRKKPGAAKGARGSQEPRLSAQDILQIAELLRNSNSIELKLSVPAAAGHRATIASIGLDPVEAEPRQAYFFDTPDLALSRAGIVVRARRIQGGRGDTVIKLRPVDPRTIEAELRRSASFKVEVDVMPTGFVCSASFKGVCTGREVLDVTTGAIPLSKLFSKEQRAFFRKHAPAGVTLDSLAIFGPTFLLKARHQPKDFDQRIIVEMWLYPDGSRILEVSTKCEPAEWMRVGTEFREYLTQRGIAFAPVQETKTRAAMDFYKAKLEADRRGGAAAKR